MASMVLNSPSTVVISVFEHHHRVVPEILTKFSAEIEDWRLVGAKQNLHFLVKWTRSDIPCVCWRLWEFETDQDGPREIHWNFASRNTMMPARLTDWSRIWPLSSLLTLTVGWSLFSWSFREYSIYSILNICDQILLASNFKSQKKNRSSKVSNPIFLSWKRNSREGCLWCW